MRKDFGAKPLMYPRLVTIIGTYSEDGIPNAMNAAWGEIAGNVGRKKQGGVCHESIINEW